ncbi:hypothetical protein CLV31_105152 [Algoriphagus aquaeductus]|uniref:Uncharacterized protein n=1 Tax=Algoriphagus aquaeductus TaxID=475299 RepID=A0A326RZH3_9BACT|nr:hypothetical protein CLV31_105152 [Algoriphagus aquaeductus]
MVKYDLRMNQLQIGKDMRVKFQTSPSTQLNFRGGEEIIRLGEILNKAGFLS